MWLQFKRVFGRLELRSLMERELCEAELELLQARTGLEYAEAMVRYNEQRVARLAQALGKR